MSCITRAPHAITWDYFKVHLADRFARSPKAVKEKVMTDINNLVQEFWTSSYGAVWTSFFAMRRLLEILKKCFNFLVCFNTIFPFSRLASTSLIKIYRLEISIPAGHIPPIRLTTEST